MMAEAMEEIVIDSFAGGGGTSEGIVAATGRDPDVAVNHNAIALAMHRINHPNTRHLVEDVVSVDAIAMCAGRPIGMLWMSPDCKDHSKAKGGKPRDKNIRGLAWACFGWVKKLPKWQRPRVVFLENVEEFQDWAPLLENGKRCPIQKGAIFKEFVKAWEALGYKVEWRERRAWRAGKKMQAATIRKRLYMIMRRDGEPIVWPEPNFGNPNDPADAEKIAAGLLKPWKTAADCIDWSLPCPSIFATSAEIKKQYGLRAIRPLKRNTLGRLAKGTHRYVVTNPRPFIVPVTHKGDFRANSADEPLRTVTSARRGEHAVVTPFITKFNRGATGHAADEPLHTITSHASEHHGGGAAPLGVVVPVLVGCGGRAAQTEPKSADEPVITQTGKADLCVAAVHLSTMRNAQKPFNEADKPFHTLTAGGANHAVVAAFLSKYYGEGLPSQAADEPLHTVTAKPRHALVEVLATLPPFGPEHYEKARKVADLLREFGYWDEREFVTVELAPGVITVLVDIGMRMLTPRERFTAQGFRPDYIIDRGIHEDGTIIKFTAEQQGYMCGNSVCPPEAEDLIGANYQRRKVKRPTPRHQRTFPLLEAAE